jgi:dTDP-4-dehydrorhamnose reductase
MRILVFGSSGQVGLCLRDELLDLKYEVIFLSRADVDITDKHETQLKIELFDPDIVINAAAYTAVDKSEEEIGIAEAVNATAVDTIAKVCKRVDAVLIHISTDYVFDGEANQPYSESSLTNPIGAYGRTKLLGECAAQGSGCKFIIIRTSWLFSRYGNNFLKTMLRIGSSNETIKVVSNEFGCPTYAPDLARAIISTFEPIKRSDFESGIFHFSGQLICSWYEFAEKIFSIARIYDLKTPKFVLPIRSVDYPTLANRPVYSVLDNTKFITKFSNICSDLDLSISSTVSFVKDSSSK